MVFKACPQSASHWILMMTFGGEIIPIIFLWLKVLRKVKGLDPGLPSLSEILSTLHSGAEREREIANAHEQLTHSWTGRAHLNVASGASLGHPEEGSF